MTEPVFFQRGEGLSAANIATLTGAQAAEGAQIDRRVRGVASLDLAGPDDLVFFDKPKFIDTIALCCAGICITTERLAQHVPPRIVALHSRDPYSAFVAAAQALFPDSLRPQSFFESAGVSPQALVHPSARIESGATIDPGVVVGPRAEIGSGTVVSPGAVIAADVRIGRDCAIGAGVSIKCALIGDRVIIHGGVRIGQDGFGFVPGAKHRKVPQVGRVIIQDDVEIGANTTIDRGAIRDTVIGEGSKIDNLVQIAHNVQIGRHCLIAGQVGLSGSSIIGDYAMLGGQVGLADHFTVGEGALVAAQSGIMSDIPAGERWGGYPARPLREWMREAATLRRMVKRPAAATNKGEQE